MAPHILSETEREAAHVWRRQQRSAGDAALALLIPGNRRQAALDAERVAAARRAQEPAARDRLRAAHAEASEAAAALTRAEEALCRAETHRDEVEASRDELNRQIDAEEAAATAELIARLGEGSTGRPNPINRIAGERRLAQQSAAVEFGVAVRAVDLLSTERDAAGKRLTGARRAVRTAIGALLTDHAITIAEDMREREQALAAERDNLDALARTITDLARGGPTPAVFPMIVREAIEPPSPPRAGRAADSDLRPWSEMIEQLAHDPEACAELDAEPAGPEDLPPAA